MAISRPTLWSYWGSNEKNLKISLSWMTSLAFICFWAQMFRLVVRPVFNLYFFESSVPLEITTRLCWQLSEVTFSVKSHTVIFFIYFFISNHPLKLSYQLSPEMARKRKATMRSWEWEREIKRTEWTLRASKWKEERAGDGGIQASFHTDLLLNGCLGAELYCDGAYVMPGYPIYLLSYQCSCWNTYNLSIFYCVIISN